MKFQHWKAFGVFLNQYFDFYLWKFLSHTLENCFGTMNYGFSWGKYRIYPFWFLKSEWPDQNLNALTWPFLVYQTLPIFNIISQDIEKFFNTSIKIIVVQAFTFIKKELILTKFMSVKEIHSVTEWGVKLRGQTLLFV